jgi:hypothetical protein
VKRLLASGSSVRTTAKAVGISAGMVSKIKAQMTSALGRQTTRHLQLP